MGHGQALILTQRSRIDVKVENRKCPPWSQLVHDFMISRFTLMDSDLLQPAVFLSSRGNNGNNRESHKIFEFDTKKL